MVHVLLIAVFVCVYLRDAVPRPFLGEYGEAWGNEGVVSWSVGSALAIWASAHIVIWLLGRHLDRFGSYRAARRAECILTASRVAAVAAHTFNVLGLGWLDAVRGWTGNLVAIDEVVACLPVLAVFALGWWSMYPIDRRLREAVIIHELDHGRAMPPMLTRWQFVLSALRHQLIWVLLPVACILTWSELTDRARARDLLPDGEAASVAVQITGLVLILVFMPLALRRVWDTVALGAGPLRDRLLGMCSAQGVRVRDLLVWRTHGTMINGAVMGIVPPLRYILLTDALIEFLPPEQVEAVTAHELGHVRRRHMLWLAASALGSITVLGVAVQLAMELWRPGLSQGVPAQGVGAVVSLSAGLVIFGFVSRRFEWQADAFAVQHLSGHQPGSGPGVVVTAEAVSAMGGALEAVARLNNIPRSRFTWRHGSIATRQRRLVELVGLRADRLAIDRQARWLAIGSAVVGLMAAGLIVWSSVSSPPEPPPTRPHPRRGTFAVNSTEVLGAICQDAGNRERLHLP